MSARKQNSVTVESEGEPMNGSWWSEWESPSKGKKRKTANPNGIFTSDVSLSVKIETTPDSWTSTGKKLKVEQLEEVQELQSPLGNIFTPSCIRKDLESDDEVQIKEPSNNTISSSPRIKHAVRRKTRSLKLLTELKDCHFKISTGKRSNTCERKTKGRVTDKKQSFTDGVAEISKGQSVDSQPLNSSATMEHLTGIQGNISNPSMSRPVSSVDQAAPLSLLENSVLTEPNPNSKFNNHTLAEHTPVKSVTSDILLPFEKTSPVWKTLETTLEVFRQIPQTPHFMKLKSEHKDKREGVALGLMMTYSILSDSIQRLSIHTEAKVFEEKIDCLESLEENGFIVDPIRSRLQQLINMKKDYTESSSKGVELKTELASEEKKSMNLHASANIHEIVLEDIRNKIAELQEREKAITDEKAGKLGLASQVKDNMSRLRENILSIDRSNELALEEFKRLISKPLGEESI